MIKFAKPLCDQETLLREYIVIYLVHEVVGSLSDQSNNILWKSGIKGREGDFLA